MGGKILVAEVTQGELFLGRSVDGARLGGRITVKAKEFDDADASWHFEKLLREAYRG
jgi:hypothetical protein